MNKDELQAQIDQLGVGYATADADERRRINDESYRLLLDLHADLIADVLKKVQNGAMDVRCSSSGCVIYIDRQMTADEPICTAIDTAVTMGLLTPARYSDDPGKVTEAGRHWLGGVF